MPELDIRKCKEKIYVKSSSRLDFKWWIIDTANLSSYVIAIIMPTSQ